MKTNAFCVECKQPISRGVDEFSQRLYGHSLCMKDQYLLGESGASGKAVDLYLALKSRNFPVVLEHFDGFKQVDLAIPGKLYIEVCMSYHHSGRQAMKDLSFSVYSQEKKIPTIIIPDVMLNHPRSFMHVVDELTKACRVVLNQTSILSIFPAVTAVQLQ
jgi:hypothetical protein